MGFANKILANLFRNVADNLEVGNSNVSDEEAAYITDYINKVNRANPLSSYQAIKYLKTTKSDFYANIRPNLKGVKVAGQKSIYFTKEELDNYKSSVSK